MLLEKEIKFLTEKDNEVLTIEKENKVLVTETDNKTVVVQTKSHRAERA